MSPAARADLEEIWDYTVGRWGEAQAERLHPEYPEGL
ncbi:MAG: type II toxin-antitoxin system RelE/ParE family toxin [Alphaproteobacteria bacterium]|nr:type II toxin-antitoxin system RelE/ParE family toxin [Alphaproteobacteria bacterium]